MKNEKLENELKKLFGDDEWHIKYWMSETSAVVELENNEIHLIQKQKIQTSFCFGYGCNGISDEESENNAYKMANLQLMGAHIIETKENRKLAKYFAACFLVPRDSLLNDLFTFGIRPSEWTYEIVLAFKTRFGVSAESFVYRLQEIKRIQKNIADEILDKIFGSFCIGK